MGKILRWVKKMFYIQDQWHTRDFSKGGGRTMATQKFSKVRSVDRGGRKIVDG